MWSKSSIQNWKRNPGQTSTLNRNRLLCLKTAFEIINRFFYKSSTTVFFFEFSSKMVLCLARPITNSFFYCKKTPFCLSKGLLEMAKAHNDRCLTEMEWGKTEWVQFHLFNSKTRKNGRNITCKLLVRLLNFLRKRANNLKSIFRFFLMHCHTDNKSNYMRGKNTTTYINKTTP